MSEFKVKIPEMRNIGQRQSNGARKLSEYESIIRETGNNLRFEVASKSYIQSRINSISDAVGKSSTNIGTCVQNLEEISDLYERTESEILDGGSETDKSEIYATPESENEKNNADNGTIIDQILNGGIAGAVIKIVAEAEGEILGVDSKGSAAGELLGGSVKASIKNGIKMDENTEKIDSVQIIDASVKAEGHLAKGSVSGSVGLLSGSLDLEVGQIEGKGSVGIGLFKDGVFAPAASVAAKVSAQVAAGKATAQVGVDDFNINREAKGKLLAAEAKAEAGIGVITVEKDDGTTETRLGVEGKVGAEAYVASGEVSGGVTIFGVKVNISLGGKILGAGATASGQITTGGVSGKIGLGLGLGLDVGLSIDWSGLTK